MPESTKLPDQSRQLLAAIVDSSDDAIISKDLKGIITSWNRAAERMFGYSAKEAVGQSISILIPKDRIEEESRILEQIQRGGKIEHFETIRRRKDGHLLRVSAMISPIKDENGVIVGASKIVRDITSQLAMLEHLQQSEERFRTTLSSIGDAVISTDHQGKISFLNAVAEKLTGWKSDEAKGKFLPEVFKIINEFTREAVDNPVHNVLKTGCIVGLANHTILIAKDGSERPIDDSGAPILGANGEIDGVVLVFRDVSERRTAEIASQRLAAIIHGSEDAIVAKDLNGIITEWNEGAHRIFGYTSEEMVGRSILNLIPPELHDEEKSIIARLRRGERIDHFETIRRTKEGRSIEISLTISPVRNADGMVIGASKIARDITERKRMERELLTAQKQLQMYAMDLENKVEERTQVLQKAVSELEAFSYSLTHDLRGPLRAIQSFLQIVIEDHGAKLDKVMLEILNKAITSTQRMDTLILDLLAFTRLSHEAMPIDVVETEKIVKEIIQERTDFQRPKAEIGILPPLLNVLGNEPSLRQCLTNLLDNAVKFVPSGKTPQVTIYSEQMGPDVRLYVEDNGIGIEAQDQNQLFRMFSRLQGNAYPGTGIGLAIVRKAVERMGGSAGMNSERGKGSRFWLQLSRAGL